MPNDPLVPDHAAPEPVVPTQVRQPWRTTVRTAFQGAVSFAAVYPLVVEAAGIDSTAPLAAGTLVVALGVTRVMALPAVNGWIERFVPFLAAAPK